MSDEGLVLQRDETAGTLAFWIHVSARSRRGSVGGVHADALRVAVTAPPVEGKANAACIAALADALSVNKMVIDIDPGSKSRRKRVKIRVDRSSSPKSSDGPDARRIAQTLHRLARGTGPG